MELWTILMLLLSLLWIFIFLLIVGVIRYEDLSKCARRFLRCSQSNQEESRNDFGVGFHRGTNPELDSSLDFLSQNVISESYKSHENTAAWSSV